MPENYDVIVIGLGSSGSAILYELAKQSGEKSNKKLLGIDQHTLPHSLGSSHGENRMTRLVSPQGIEYVQLAKRSVELQKQMEEESGVKLFQRTGGLLIGPVTSPSNFLSRIQSSAKSQKITHQNLSSQDLSKNYPQLLISQNDQGYYEESMGTLSPEECIKIRLKLAVKKGAILNQSEKLLNYERTKDGRIQVTTNKGTYTTRKLVLTAGAWMADLLNPRYDVALTVHRATMYSLHVSLPEVEKYKLGNFPIVMRDLGEGHTVVVFPITDDKPYVTVMCFPPGEKSVVKKSPDLVERNLDDKEKQKDYEKFIAPYFSGITDKCLAATVCLYTTAPGNRFVVDFLPNYGNAVVAVSACARQGFKYAAAIGESIAERVLTHRNEKNMDLFKTFGGVYTKIPRISIEMFSKPQTKHKEEELNKPTTAPSSIIVSKL